jgi:hypothetical protein
VKLWAARKHLLTALLLLSSNLLFISPANAATTYSFTNASATGRTGPTQAQINTAYGSTNLSGLVTINTQGIQEWTAPATGTYSISLAGAKGGGSNAGKGARLSGDFELTQGQVLKILVGQMGISYGSSSYSGGGGGGSFVWLSSSTTEPLIAAGGGGGQGGTGRSGVNASVTTSGTSGTPGATDTSGSWAGAGGTLGSAGQTYDYNLNSWDAAAGAGWKGNSTTATQYTGLNQNFAYRPLNGGMGGLTFSANGDNSGGFGGGGGGGGDGASTQSVGAGGGGYSGGGNGSNDSSANRGAGGGGGSYSSGTNQTSTAGSNSSHGYVTITAVAPDTTPPTFTSSSTFSAAENIATSATAATIRVSESATVTISSGADAARFNIARSETNTAIIKFNVSPDFEAPADVGGNNVYEITLTATDAAANAGTQSITITVTNVVDTSGFNSLALAGSATTAAYRTAVVITANITVASKVTFRVNGKILPGCKNKSTTGSSPNIVATCTWKPSNRGNVSLTAGAVPTGAGISSTTSSPVSIMVGKRVGPR